MMWGEQEERIEETRTVSDTEMSGGEQSQKQSTTDATEAATAQSDFAEKLLEEMIHLTQGNRQCIWIPEGDVYSSEYPEELTTGINI
eukprot:3605059-Rhodomonas_salina.1